MPHADVIVVGAGLAGLAVAHHLAPHRRVVVVEQGPGLGPEASAQNAGMIRTLVEDPVERVLAVRSAAWLRDPGPHWTGEAPARTTGAFVGLTQDPHHLDDGVAHLRARGIDVTADVDQAPRWADPTAWGASFYIASAQVADPPTLLRGFAATVAQHGGEVRTGLRVVGPLGEDRVLGVRTDQGPIEANAVVIAAGAYGGPLAARFGVDRPLVPLRRSIWRTEPHPLATPDGPWVWIDDLGLYARPDGDRFLVCACDEQPTELPEGPGSLGAADPAMAEIVRARLAEALPALADVRFAEGWSGLRTFAPDRRPLLGPDADRPGLWWNAGLGGAGVTCAVAAGEAVASWLCDRPTPWLPPRPVAPARRALRRFPIRPRGDWATTELIDVG